jgi:hypothetical protein
VPKTKATKRSEALQRQEAWAKLTPSQQFNDLCNRGHMHCKQADKLYQILENKETIK